MDWPGFHDDIAAAFTGNIRLCGNDVDTGDNPGMGNLGVYHYLATFFVSDEGFLLTPLPDGGFVEGTVAGHVELMESFANPIILLFLGGFVLAGCAGKVGLDAFLAKNLLRMFGRRPPVCLARIPAAQRHVFHVHVQHSNGRDDVCVHGACT